MVFEPLLLEPHPEHPGKFRIIDGDRRWTNSKVMVEAHKKDQYRTVAAEVTDRTLTEEEWLRVWIYIHRQRKEWDAKEKEMVAYRLVDLVGRASAANMLGITVRELDKLVEIYELSENLTNLPDPATSITWAREIKNLNRKLLAPDVLTSVIRKVNDQRITALKESLKNIYWYKDDLRLFLLALDLPSGIVSKQGWHDDKEYKVRIAGKVLDELVTLGDDGLGPMRRLIRAVLDLTNFDHLRNLDDGPAKVQSARRSVEALRKIVERHDESFKGEHAEGSTDSKVASAVRRRNDEIESLQGRFQALVSERDHQKRGVLFESFLRDLFSAHEVLGATKQDSPGPRTMDGAARLRVMLGMGRTTRRRAGGIRAGPDLRAWRQVGVRGTSARANTCRIREHRGG